MIQLFNREDNNDTTQSLSNRLSYSNYDLLWIDYYQLPAQAPGAKSIQITLDDDFNIDTSNNTNTDDPSTIYVQMLVEEVQDGEYIEPLGYWPSYYLMHPEQKYVYLIWLLDVTQETDMGFVFTYYYGLERHLILGKRKEAFAEIVKLRRHHKNKSFQNYSKNALIFSCLVNKDPIPIMTLVGEDAIEGFNSAQIYLAYLLGVDLSPENLIYCFAEINAKAKAAIKANKGLFLSCCSQTLLAEYGQEGFPLASKWDITQAPLRNFQAFCNYTFPEGIRDVKIPEFYFYKEFVAELERVFTLSYNLYKEENAIIRKKVKSEMSDSDILNLRVKKETSRLNKLFKQGLIKKAEYDLLIKNIK